MSFACSAASFWSFYPIPDVWMEFEEVVPYGGCEPQKLGMREGQAPPSSARVGGSGHKHEKFLPATGKHLFFSLGGSSAPEQIVQQGWESPAWDSQALK